MIKSSEASNLIFLNGGGRMEQLIREHDWTSTNLGSIDSWPQHFRISLGNLLRSKFPMCLYWGAELLGFYNDAYTANPVTNNKHDLLPGLPAKIACAGIWHILGPIIESVLKGESVWREDLLIPIHRNGKLQDSYWNISYTPVINDRGIVDGVLGTCQEIAATPRVQQLIAESERKFRNTVAQAPVGICILKGHDFIVEVANKNYLALVDRSEDKFIGRPLFESLPEVADLVAPLLFNVLNTGESFYGNEFPAYIRRHGKNELVYFNFVYQALKEIDGSVSGIMVVASEITELVEAKHGLSESEKQFRNVVMQSPVPMTIFRGRDYVVEMANDEMIKNIWRKEEEEVLGKKILDVFPELNQQKYPELLKKVFESGEPYRENESVADVLGNEGLRRFYLDYEYKPLFEINGLVSGIMVTVNDVTEKVLARKKAEQAESRLRLAIEASNLGTWDLNLKTGALDYSNRFAEIFGHVSKAAVSLTALVTQVFPGDMEEVKLGYEQAVKTGTYDQEARIRRTDGSTGWIRIQGKIIYDEQAKPQGLLGTLMDITVQKQSQQAIEESEERTRLAVDAAEMGTFDLNLLTLKFISSPRLNHIFGYPGLSDITQEHLLKAFLPEDRHLHEEAIKQAILKGPLNYEARIAGPDKSIHWIRVFGKVVQDDHEKALRLYGTVLDITTEKLTRIAMEQSEARLNIAIQAAELGTWELNLLTRETNYSDRYLEILGFKKGERVSHEALLERVHPDDLKLRERAMSVAMKTGILDHELRIVPAAKSIRWIKSKGKVFYNDQGQAVSMLGTIMDITEQKFAFENLRKTEERFRLLANFMPQFVWTADVDGVLNYFNDAVYQYSGLSKDEVQSRGWLEIVHPDDRELNVTKWLHAIGTQEDFIFEHRFRRHDGEFRWQLSRAIPFRDDGGNIQMWIGTSTDIHEQKLLNAELQKSELLFKTISNASPVGLWMTDKTAKNTFVNDTWISWTGIPLEQQFGRGWLDRVVEEDKISAPAKFRESQEKREKFSTEFRIIRSDGQLRWCLTEGSPFFDINGEYAGYAGSVTDITERKMIEEELESKVKERTNELNIVNSALEKSNGELEQFAYVASHDLQEPLRKIKTFVGRLQEGSQDMNQEQTAVYMSKIVSAAGRMSDLIRDLLEYSRTAKISEQFVATDLNKVMENVIEDFELMINQKNAEIVMVDLPVISGIPHQMNQLFSNLVNNSLKFSREDVQPLIKITVRKPEALLLVAHSLPTNIPYCEILFIDNGIGFSNEFSEKIFEIFQRLNARSTYAGSGIGLSICRKIVLNHQGVIFAQSVEGEGTSFHILLPVGHT